MTDTENTMLLDYMRLATTLGESADGKKDKTLADTLARQLPKMPALVKALSRDVNMGNSVYKMQNKPTDAGGISTFGVIADVSKHGDNKAKWCVYQWTKVGKQAGTVAKVNISVGLDVLGAILSIPPRENQPDESGDNELGKNGKPRYYKLDRNRITGRPKKEITQEEIDKVRELRQAGRGKRGIQAIARELQIGTKRVSEIVAMLGKD